MSNVDDTLVDGKHVLSTKAVMEPRTKRINSQDVQKHYNSSNKWDYCNPFQSGYDQRLKQELQSDDD